MVRVASASHTIISASEPSTITPWVDGGSPTQIKPTCMYYLLGVDVEHFGCSGAGHSHVTARVHQARVLGEREEEGHWRLSSACLWFTHHPLLPDHRHAVFHSCTIVSYVSHMEMVIMETYH